jgi:aquaporin Z
MSPKLARSVAAEFVGTALLVFLAVGSAVAGIKTVGDAGVAFAFGLVLLALAYAIGPISGCHINPAVTLGLWAIKKTETKDVPYYIGGQIVGGLLGALVIFVIASGVSGFSAKASGFASNGYGAHSPGGFPIGSAIIVEIVFTALFIFVIASTSRKSMPPGFTGITVGLMLTLIHLVTIPVDNTSVNPVRSLATAVFQGGWALRQLWVFIVFPIVGGIIGAVVWRALVPSEDA